MKEQDVAMLSEAMQRRLAKTPLAFHRLLLHQWGPYDVHERIQATGHLTAGEDI